MSVNTTLFNIENLKAALSARIALDGGKLLTPAEREQKVLAGETVYHLGSIKVGDRYYYGAGAVMTPESVKPLATPPPSWANPSLLLPNYTQPKTNVPTVPTGSTNVTPPPVTETPPAGLPSGWVDTPIASSNTFQTIVGIFLLVMLLGVIKAPFKMFAKRR